MRRPVPGSAMHLAGALFGIVTKTQLTHVPYKSGGATTAAVMGGEATTAFNTLETVIALIRAGRLRPLAVSTRERSPAAAGRADRDGGRSEGLRGDRLVRPDGAGGHAARDRRAGERAKSPKAMATPAIRKLTLEQGATPVGNAPAEFDRFVRDGDREVDAHHPAGGHQTRDDDCDKGTRNGPAIEELAHSSRDALGRRARAACGATRSWCCSIRSASSSPARCGPRCGSCASASLPTAGTGATVLARGWPAHDPRTAALLNGIAGRAIELCEGLRLVSGQAGDADPARRAGGRRACRGAPAATCWRPCSSATKLPRGSATAFTPRPLAHQNGQVIAARRRSGRERACAASTRGVSAAPCASRRRSS